MKRIVRTDDTYNQYVLNNYTDSVYYDSKTDLKNKLNIDINNLSFDDRNHGIISNNKDIYLYIVNTANLPDVNDFITIVKVNNGIFKYTDDFKTPIIWNLSLYLCSEYRIILTYNNSEKVKVLTIGSTNTISSKLFYGSTYVLSELNDDTIKIINNSIGTYYNTSAVDTILKRMLKMRKILN